MAAGVGLSCGGRPGPSPQAPNSGLFQREAEQELCSPRSWRGALGSAPGAMVYCAALNCRNATSGTYKNSSVTFYAFPLQNKALLQQWIRNMGRDMETPSKYQRLCSDHFEESSFQRNPLQVHKNRRLLKEAVPSKFLLGEDGTWLVGTPHSYSDSMRNKSHKHIHTAEHWRVSGKFPNGAEGPTLEDWQNEFYKTILKKNCGSLTTPGKDHPVPKVKILVGEAAQVKIQQDLEGRKITASLGTGYGGAMIISQLESGVVRGSPSGGSQNLRWNLSGRGEAPESPQNPTNQANPLGKGRSSSFPAEDQPEFSQFLLSQQGPAQTPESPWFICTDCGKSFARHVYLRRHLKIHSGRRPHTCTYCGKSFLQKPGLTNHLRTHLHIIRVPSTFQG